MLSSRLLDICMKSAICRMRRICQVLKPGTDGAMTAVKARGKGFHVLVTLLPEPLVVTRAPRSRHDA